MTAKTAPADSTEIRTTADDDFAPHAIIGWIAPLDQPAGDSLAQAMGDDAPRAWVALYPDFGDDSDPQRVAGWSRPLATAELAEADVRARYERALPALRAEAERWAADYRQALAEIAERSAATA